MEQTKYISKESLCEELGKQYAIFLKQKDLYDKWSQCWSNVYLAQKSRKSKLPLILTIIIFALGFFTLPVLIFVLAASMNTMNLENFSNREGLQMIIVMEVVMLIINILVWVGVPLCYILRNRSIKKKIEKNKAEMNEIGQKLREHYYSVQNPIVPFEYSSPYILWEIYELVRIGRANSVNEAIDIYKSDTDKKLEYARMQKTVKKQRLADIATTCAAVYFMSKPDQIDIYLK